MGKFKPGDQHRNWQGGKYINDRGYLMISIGQGKYGYAHRIEMEKYLGRELKKEEIVHHINGDRLDNRIENLEIMTLGNHSRLHQTGFKASLETIEKLKKIRIGTNQKECHQQWKSEISEESIRCALMNHKTQKEAAKCLGICADTLRARMNYYSREGG